MGEEKDLVGREKTDREFFLPTPPQLVILVLTSVSAVRQGSYEKDISIFAIHYNIYMLMYMLSSYLVRVTFIAQGLIPGDGLYIPISVFIK